MGPLSLDLRTRVVSAVSEEGMSCRAAARRFGVSFSSAIRWMASLRERGDYAALPMGGDQRSRRVEAHADYLLDLSLRGRVGDWRAGLGRSSCSLLARSFVCECHTI